MAAEARAWVWQFILDSDNGYKAHRFWALQRAHAYDAFGLEPRLNDPKYFNTENSCLKLQSSPDGLLHRRRDVRDVATVYEPTEPAVQPEIVSVSDSELSVAGSDSEAPAPRTWRTRRKPRVLAQIQEETPEDIVGFPTGDGLEESDLPVLNAAVAKLAELCYALALELQLPRFQLRQISQLPYEWPMARLNLELPSVSTSFSQNVARVCTEAMLEGTVVTDSWLTAQCERFAWVAAGQTATLLMALFQDIHLLEVTSSVYGMERDGDTRVLAKGIIHRTCLGNPKATASLPQGGKAICSPDRKAKC